MGMKSLLIQLGKIPEIKRQILGNPQLHCLAIWMGHNDIRQVLKIPPFIIIRWVADNTLKTRGKYILMKKSRKYPIRDSTVEEILRPHRRQIYHPKLNHPEQSVRPVKKMNEIIAQHQEKEIEATKEGAL
jgi:hypothetical protein